MALFFATLLADLPAWVARDDVADSAASFIRVAEPEIYRRVRIMEMEANADFTFNTGNNYTVGLPDNWLKFRFVYFPGSRSNPRCAYVAPDIFHTLNNLPRDAFNAILYDAEIIYTIEANQIKVYAPPGTSGEFTLTTGYFEGYRFAGDFANETCPVLSLQYDIYLTAVLMQAWDFVDEPEQVAKYERRLDKLVAQIDTQEGNRRQTSAPVRRSTNRPGTIV